MDSKIIQDVKACLKTNLEFIQNYLPLCNAHANDFFVHDLWKNHIPPCIQEELLCLSPQELCTLPSKYLHVQTHPKENTVENGTEGNRHLLKTFGENPVWKNCQVIQDKYNIYDKKNKTISSNWQNDCLEDFVKEAAQHDLNHTKIMCSLEDLWSSLASYGSADKTHSGILHFMTEKKSHEVDILTELVQALSSVFDIDVILDVGSGKGYLSAQLALKVNRLVIGIDASPTNTSGALRRANILGKQWKGLLRRKGQLQSPDGETGSKNKQERKKNKAHSEQEVIEENDNDSVLLGSLFAKCEECNFKSPKLEDSEKECTSARSSAAMDKEILQDSFHKLNMSADLEDKQDLCLTKDCVETSETTYVLQNQWRKNNGRAVRSKKQKLKEFSGLYHPITLFVDPSLDLFEVTMEALQKSPVEVNEKQKNNLTRESTLMLTGLHTCGALGSSLLDLFLSNQQVKCLCYVGCCYHLMDETFVANPFTDKEPGIEGFPKSNFLKDQKIGLGRVARSLASHSLYRTRNADSGLSIKTFKRSLLQKILHDLGCEGKENFKGLRGLQDKTSSMLEYTKKAFEKLGLQQHLEKITPEFIDHYCVHQEDKEHKLAAFTQLKSVLAPCLESIVLLDRICFLLEQDCVKDVKLVQLFDPSVSPRCFGIFALKH